MSSYLAKPGELEQAWHVVDATDQVLGRMATKIAMVLQGKHKPTYTPHVDTGDFVIVTNAAAVTVTGRKSEQRTYATYSGYIGGRHEYSYKTMSQQHPEKVIELAVRRMMPKTKMGMKMMKKLKIYKGDQHDHQAQQPQALAV